MHPDKPEIADADTTGASPVTPPSPPIMAEMIDLSTGGPPSELEFGIPILAEIPSQPTSHVPPRYRRRIALPVILFLITCVSTFLAGSGLLGGGFSASNGLIYMGAAMAILLAHEMGHFLQAVRYHVPASLPYFLPMPLSPFGTMGAVISMRGSNADRKELFDIGLTGPIAGLVVAIPLIWYGIETAAPFVPAQVTAAQGNGGSVAVFPHSLLVRWMVSWLRPDLAGAQGIANNPIMMAGWLGLFITGLNMIPVSQLDGGHVAYALFGRKAHLLAKLVVLAALLFILSTRGEAYGLLVMVALVLFIGVAHPPTADDTVPLGWGRRLIGLLSLAIPILCLSGLPTFR